VSQRPVPGRLNRRRRRSVGTVPPSTPTRADWIYRVRRYEMVGSSIHPERSEVEDMFGLGGRAEELSRAIEELGELVAIQHKKGEWGVVSGRLDADGGQAADRKAGAREAGFGVHA
jgi:hypothetical protein